MILLIMNILLTGGAGYIGSHTALAFLDAGHEVTIIDNLITGNKNLIPIKANFIEININNSSRIENLLKKEKFDALLHFAGYIQVEESINKPKKYMNNNTRNSEILFDVCAKNNLTNVIFSSTAAVYGNPNNKKPINENNKITSINPYGESKILTERYLNKNKKLNHIILRYFNVAGADSKMRSGEISKKSTHLIKIASEVAVGRKEKITINGNDYPTKDGTAIRDYIHVSDLADIHLKACKYLLDNKESKIMNCGYGKGFSVNEVLEMFNIVSEKKIKIEIGERRKGDPSMLVSDISRLKNLLNWEPKYNDLSFIIKTAIDWEKKILNKDYA